MRKILFMLSVSLMFLVQCEKSVNNEYEEKTPLGMVKISAAGKSFQMGSNEGRENEKPVHTVKFTRDFCMDRTEVMQKDYKQLMGLNPSYFKGDNLPVENLSWFEAVLYCNARSKRDGFDTVYIYTTVSVENLEIHLDRNGYHLPTEAQWEYAYRAGTTTKYYWGDASDSATLSKYAWYGKNSNLKTHPLGTKIPNAYGLYDMSGSVWEWCNDWCDENYYSVSPVNDPAGPEGGSNRVIRGGSWYDDAVFCKSSWRPLDQPVVPCSSLGFRLAKSL